MSASNSAPAYPTNVKLPRQCPVRPDVVATTVEEVTELFGWRKVASNPVRYAPQSWSRAARSAHAQKNAKAKREAQQQQQGET